MSLVVPESVASSEAPPKWVEAVVDCPNSDKLYTYAIPPDLMLKPGDIIQVPFGSQELGAIVVAVLTNLPETQDPRKVRSVTDLITPDFFPTGYWPLLQQVAQYYCTDLMQVAHTALPPGLLAKSQRRIRLIAEQIPDDALVFLRPAAQKVLTLLQQSQNQDYAWRFLQQKLKQQVRSGVADLVKRGWAESYLEPPRPIRPKYQQVAILVAVPNLVSDLTDRQQQILDTLKHQGGDLPVQELLALCKTSTSTLKKLAEKGYLVLEEREVLRAETGPNLSPDRPQIPTSDQQRAIETLNNLQTFTQVLLHGVTGSGKTEVYLQIIAPRLAAGQSALVLVPEIGLTPQLTDRFRRRFKDQVFVYHSGLSDGERYDTWRQMLQGQPQVVIGTRSAIFAPLPNLGLIILDEEHDSSFKQHQPTPCYHARTVAQWRAQLVNCPLVLGSATPCLETFRIRNSIYLSLPNRIQNRPMPTVEVVDMRVELQEGNRSMFSRSLQQAIRELKERGQQGILFIQRRGHSTFVSCRSCGEVLDCPHCDVSLAYHHVHAEAQPLLRCHYCNFVQQHPRHCPACGSPYLKFFGGGTQKATQELARLFPEVRSIRFDSDTTSTKGAHRLLLTQFATGEADLLVGTQMLTKGIDLPQVTLVGVLAADGLLYLPDFRSGERACQTLLQVAGRAGRGDDPGRVIVQTYSPHHEVIEAVQQDCYEQFLERELRHRSPLRYPPFSRLVLLRFSSVNPQAVRSQAEAVAEELQAHVTEEMELLGPAPAPILRVADRYRWQILLKLPLEPPIAVRLHLEAIRSSFPQDSVSLTIDVDPLSLA
jgi:primosomal protein N' (replication factor Y)